MTVFLGFLLSVFIIGGALERRGRRIRTGTLMILTTVVALSFYSLRIMA